MSREAIHQIAELFGVPFGWGFMRRLAYLEETSAMICDRVESLLKLRTECRAGTETILCDQQIDFWLKAFQKFQWKIKDLKYPNRKRPEGITDAMIEQAKQYPIGDLIDSGSHRGKMVNCPFHEDKHPSASIKNNRVHCFSCNKTWDAISFIMETRKTDFVGAVKFLN